MSIINSYDIDLQDHDLNELEIELIGFRANGRPLRSLNNSDGSPARLLSRFDHMINISRMIWGDKVEVYKDGVENTYMTRIWKALCSNKRVGLAGCANSCKSFSVSTYCIIFGMAFPESTSIFVSTTSSLAADDRMWGEIKSLHEASRTKFGHVIGNKKTLSFEEKDPKQSITDSRNSIKVVPIPAGRDGKAAIGTIIGRKNQHVIWVIDEAPNMEHYVLDSQIVANLNANPFFQLVVIGNPAFRDDPHGIFCQPVGGWESIQDSDNEWKIKSGGVCVVLDGLSSPNYDAPNGNVPFPYLMHEAKRISQEEECGGSETLAYSRMVRGKWSSASMSSTILSKQFVQQYGADKIPVMGTGKFTRIAGIDSAIVQGGDKCCMTIGLVGDDALGTKVAVMEGEPIEINPTIVPGQEYAKLLAAKIVGICRTKGIMPDGIFLDVTGDGGILAQHISTLFGGEPINLVTAKGTPDDRKVSSVDTRTCKQAYDRKITQMFYEVRLAIQFGVFKGFPVESQAASELYQRRFNPKAAGGKISVETKEEMRRRTGMKSPDASDSIVFFVHGCLAKGVQLTGKPAPSANPLKINTVVRNAMKRRRGMGKRRRSPYSDPSLSGSSYSESPW